jgi:hypothetical protein
MSGDRVRFSSDGRSIAISAGELDEKDSVLAQIVSASTGQPIASLPRSSIAGAREVPAIAWSPPKAAALVAVTDDKNDTSWFSWAPGTRPERVTSAPKTGKMEPLGDGSFLHAAGRLPQVLESDGRPRFAERGIEGGALARTRHDLSIDPSGESVQFSNGATTLSFNVTRRELAGPDVRAVVRAVDSAGGTIVTDTSANWGEEIKINGVLADMQHGGRSYTAVSVCATGDLVALGSPRGVWALGRDGKILEYASKAIRWWVPFVGISAVVLSRDCTLAVAAGEDGLIYWIRVSDGEVLARLFVDPRSKRWIVWTSSGYYDTSPGAEDLVGWSVNRGFPQAPDFFPLSRFRARYYRPDVAARVVGELDESRAIATADAGRVGAGQAQAALTTVLPPVIDIVSPGLDIATASAQVTVAIRIRTPGDAPASSLRVRVNGQTSDIGEQRNISVQLADGVRPVTVRIPARDSELAFFAENRFGVSAPTIVRVRWQGRRIPPA